jgi:hypothetical protein
MAKQIFRGNCLLKKKHTHTDVAQTVRTATKAGSSNLRTPGAICESRGFK